MYKIIMKTINSFMQMAKNRKTQNFRGLKIRKKL